MKGILPLVILSVALLIPFPAQAGPAYIGAGIGQSHAEISSLGSFSENDFGYKIYGGYRFQKYFAAELFYLDLTEIGSAEKPGGTSVEASGFGVGVLGAYPLTETFEVFGKLGLLRWSTDLNMNTGVTIVSMSDDGTDPGFGIGLLSRINEQFTFRLEIETYDVQFATLDGSVSLLSFGVLYRF